MRSFVVANPRRLGILQLGMTMIKGKKGEGSSGDSLKNLIRQLEDE